MGGMSRKVRRGQGFNPPPPRDTHKYLEIGVYHRNAGNAERYADALIAEASAVGSLGIPIERLVIIKQAREVGTAETVRSAINRATGDPFFPFSIVVEMPGDFGLSIGMETAGSKVAPLSGPQRTALVEDELTADILTHRQAAVASARDLQKCFMFYRSYIFVCSALVEAFLNRAVEISRIEGGVPSTQLKALIETRGSFEERLELWMQEFCGCAISQIKQTPAWDHLKQLREVRNKITHPGPALWGNNLKQIAWELNLVRLGVGGFMLKLRELQGLPPLPFAERLATAPCVQYRPKR